MLSCPLAASSRGLCGPAASNSPNRVTLRKLPSPSRPGMSLGWNSKIRPRTSNIQSRSKRCIVQSQSQSQQATTVTTTAPLPTVAKSGIEIPKFALVVLTALTHGLSGLTMNMTGITIEALSHTTQASVQSIGACVSFTGLGNLAGIVCAHWLSRLCESLIGASGCILSFNVHDMLSKRLGHRRAGSAINLVNAAFGIGAIIAPLFASFCAKFQNILFSYTLIAVFAALGAAIWALIHVIDGKTSRTVVQDPATPKPAAMNWSIVTPIALLIGLSVGAERVFSTWFFIFVSSVSLVEAGLAVSLFWSSFAIGRFIAVPASRIFKPMEILSRTIPIALLGSSAALFGTSTSWSILSAAVACGLGLSCTFGNGMSYLSGHQQLTHASQGVIGLGTGLSGALFPTSVSVLSCMASIQVAFPMVLVGLISTQALLVAYLRKRQSASSLAR